MTDHDNTAIDLAEPLVIAAAQAIAELSGDNWQEVGPWHEEARVAVAAALRTLGECANQYRREYRIGSHNPRNIYRTGFDRSTDEHVGVMFTPETARLVVGALNAEQSNRRAHASTLESGR